MGLKDLAAKADAGPWWFDGRDIFHQRPGTNLQQIILPIPSAAETFHLSQAVNPDTAKLASLAPEMAALLMDTVGVLETLRWANRPDCYCGDVWTGRHSEQCEQVRALLVRFADLEKKT